LTEALRRLAASLRVGRVAVLKGGWSRERPISLKTGAAVEASLRRLKIPFHSIDVRRDVASRLKKLRPDLCIIALHGAFGEDGEVQKILDRLGVAYTGSGAASSALAMDKIASKKKFVAARVPTPAWAIVRKVDLRRKKNAALAPALRMLARGPVFVKPFDQGSAIGVSRVDDPRKLRPAVDACVRMSDAALVESFVEGRELTVGILGRQILPVIEIVPEHAFYDFHSKYARGGSRHLVPAKIGAAATRRVRTAAMRAYRALGCAAYGRVDVMLDGRGRPWVLEVNTIPGMTATSLLPDAARAVGIRFDELVLKIIQYSLETRRGARLKTKGR
jgi:D-alanine-D-alanine ligase